MTAKQRANRRAYNKQLTRLRRQEARMRARGYVFESDTGAYRGFVPQERPERITAASVRKLERITSEEYYRNARYVDPSTGEVISGAEGRRREASFAAQKAAETRRKRKTTPEPDWTIEPSEPPVEDEASDWVPTVEDVKDTIKLISQLVEYGGWIQDEKRGHYLGGTYRSKVEKDLVEIEGRWRGITDSEKVLIGRKIQSFLEGYLYGYEPTAFKAGGAAAEFMAASEQYETFITTLYDAMSSAYMLTR